MRFIKTALAPCAKAKVCCWLQPCGQHPGAQARCVWMRARARAALKPLQPSCCRQHELNHKYPGGMSIPVRWWDRAQAAGASPGAARPRLPTAGRRLHLLAAAGPDRASQPRTQFQSTIPAPTRVCSSFLLMLENGDLWQCSGSLWINETLSPRHSAPPWSGDAEGRGKGASPSSCGVFAPLRSAPGRPHLFLGAAGGLALQKRPGVGTGSEHSVRGEVSLPGG